MNKRVTWREVLRALDDPETRSYAVSLFRDRGFTVDSFEAKRKARATLAEVLVHVEDKLEFRAASESLAPCHQSSSAPLGIGALAMSDLIDVPAILTYLSEGSATTAVARAARKFAGSNPIEFSILVAYHARSPYGIRNSALRAWKNDQQGLADILVLFGLDPDQAGNLAAAFIAGECSDARDTACLRYASAALRLDEWLLGKGYRKAEKDRRAIVWFGIEEPA
jgi:hypothetical protein